MKKLLCVVCFVLLLCAPALADVAVSAANFPDSAFRTYILSHLDTDHNGTLSDSEIAAVVRLDIGFGYKTGFYSVISSLKGIEYFTSLEYLNCNNHNLTELDVSKNIALRYLDCSRNRITSLDVSKNTALVTLDCSINRTSLKTLDVSNNTALEDLNCSYNSIQALDLSKNTALVSLDVSHARLQDLDLSNNTKLLFLNYSGYNNLENFDIGKYTGLQKIICQDKGLDALDVSRHTDLRYLDCSYNVITALDVTKNTKLEVLMATSNQLTAINVGNCTKLTRLEVGSNQLTALDVSKNTALRILDCSVNSLSSLNVSKNTKLVHIDCSINPLKTIDVSKLTGLEDLYCSYTQLSELDVRNNPKLWTLDCACNSITALDLSKNTSLYALYCGKNRLTALDVSHNTLLEFLHCGDNDAFSYDNDNVWEYINNNYYLTYLSNWNSNQISELDLSNNTSLWELFCSGNNLSALDLSNCPELRWLDCSDNNLTALDLTNCPELSTLIAAYNHIKNFQLNENASLQELDCSGKDNLNNFDFTVYDLSSLTCKDKGLTALDVSMYTNLNYLDCSGNYIKQLDVSKCMMLEGLTCSNNEITSLNIGEAWSLQYIYCQNNRLTQLDLSYCTGLNTLDCSNNEIAALDVSGLSSLTYLDCSVNKLKELDVSNNDQLYDLYCNYNLLTVLDVSDNYNLSSLYCSNNKITELGLFVDNLTALGCAYNPLNESIDFSMFTSLEYLDCSGLNLTELDLSNNPYLRSLTCSDNKLTSLNLSNNTDLDELYCDDNQLTSLDLSKNIFLVFFTCRRNQLSELDLSNNTELWFLHCDENKLATLDLSKNTNLMSFGGDGQIIEASGGLTLNLKAVVEDISRIVADSVQALANGKEIETSYNSSTGTATFAAIPVSVNYEYRTGNEDRVLYVTVMITLTAPVITTTSLTVGTVNTAYIFTLRADGTEPISWDMTGGTLPNGLTLGTDGTLSGTPKESGDYTFTVQAKNTEGVDTATFTLTIEGEKVGAVIVASSPDIIIVGQQYSFQFRATGTEPITWSLVKSKPHNGITLSSSGLLSGTTSKTGGVTLTVKAKNEYGYDTKSFTFNSYALPEITTTSLKEATVGKSYNAAIAKTGTAPLTLALSGDMPEGMKFDAAKGKITGTPARNGTYTITLILSNTAGTYTKNLDLKVNAILPKITGNMKAGTAGKTYKAAFKATGTTPITMSYSGTLPKGLSFDSSSWTFYGTPEEVCNNREIAITASNMGGDTTAKYYLTVKGVAPKIAAKSLPAGVIGRTYSADVTATGTAPITWSAAGLPDGLSMNTNGSISGVPTKFGTFTASVTATNSTKAITKKYKMTITSPPVFGDESTLKEATAGTAYTHKFSMTGTAKIKLTQSGGTLPKGMSINGMTLKGKPTESGTFTFTVTAQNVAGSTAQDFTLKVNAVAPKISGSLKNGTVGRSYKAALKAAGTAPIVWTYDGTLPKGIAFADGLFSGTPTEAFDDYVSVMASNDGGTDTKTFRLVVKSSSKNSKSTPPEITYEAPVITMDIDSLGSSSNYVVVCELSEITVDESGMYDLDIVLPEDVDIGAELVWLAGSDEPSEDDEIAEFYSDDGEEITTVPESRNITVSAWLNAGTVYKPKIAVKIGN